jgi:DNA primase
MACHLSGVPTAVATSGTSFGDGHVKVLRRLLMDADQFLGEVVFTFDGDAAGQRAALRAFDLEERFVTQTFVAVQADGLDPCDLRVKHGPEAVRDLVARRVPVFEFAIRSELAKHNLETNEGRIAALDASARIIARIKDRGLRDRYAVSLDRWLGMLNEEFVLARVREHAARAQARPGTAGSGPGRNPSGPAGVGPGRMRGGPGGPVRPGSPAGPGSGAPGGPGMAGGPGAPGARGGPGAPQGAAGGTVGGSSAAAGSGAARAGGPGVADGPAGASDPAEHVPYDLTDPVIQVEREALKLAVQRPQLTGGLFDHLAELWFTVPAHRLVRATVARAGGTAGRPGGGAWVQTLLDTSPDDEVRAAVHALAVEPIRYVGDDEGRYATAVLARVQELAVSRELAEAKGRLERTNPEQAGESYTRLFGRVVELEARKRTLRAQAAGSV